MNSCKKNHNCIVLNVVNYLLLLINCIIILFIIGFLCYYKFLLYNIDEYYSLLSMRNNLCFRRIALPKIQILSVIWYYCDTRVVWFRHWGGLLVDKRRNMMQQKRNIYRKFWLEHWVRSRSYSASFHVWAYWEI